MSDTDMPYRRGVDRMDHPLSHLAAVVAGVAFIVVAGCGALLLSDPRGMLRSSNWWSATVLAGAVLAVCVIGYFRPGSRAIYLPVWLAGLVTGGLCVWHFWGWVVHAEGEVDRVKGFFQSLVFFCAWLAWAGRTMWHLRPSRRDSSGRDGVAGSGSRGAMTQA